MDGRAGQSERRRRRRKKRAREGGRERGQVGKGSRWSDAKGVAAECAMRMACGNMQLRESRVTTCAPVETTVGETLCADNTSEPRDQQPNPVRHVDGSVVRLLYFDRVIISVMFL